jgi:hypothetical protein
VANCIRIWHCLMPYNAAFVFQGVLTELISVAAVFIGISFHNQRYKPVPSFTKNIINEDSKI